jgi:hypothetical protein
MATTRQAGETSTRPARREAKDARARPRRLDEQPGSRRWMWWVVGGIAAIVVSAAAGYFAYSLALPPGTQLPDLGNLHVNRPSERTVEYNSDPPTSGPHFPYIAPWGIHTEPIEKELQVHNLEDGGVMVQYHCAAGCPDLVDKLKAVVNRYPDQVILAPYPGLKQRIALTAWTRIDVFDDFDESRIVRFIQAYRGIDHHKR